MYGWVCVAWHCHKLSSPMVRAPLLSCGHTAASWCTQVSPRRAALPILSASHFSHVAIGQMAHSSKPNLDLLGWVAQGGRVCFGHKPLGRSGAPRLSHPKNKEKREIPKVHAPYKQSHKNHYERKNNKKKLEECRPQQRLTLGGPTLSKPTHPLRITVPVPLRRESPGLGARMLLAATLEAATGAIGRGGGGGGRGLRGAGRWELGSKGGGCSGGHCRGRRGACSGGEGGRSSSVRQGHVLRRC